jgi:hypothetical protein
MEPAKCCFIPCDADAEWQIVYSPAPDAISEGCSAHVGELLEAGEVNTVFLLAQPDAATTVTPRLVGDGTFFEVKQ